MDSFYAAAENLDSLLDELEENEDNLATGASASCENGITTSYKDAPAPLIDFASKHSHPEEIRAPGMDNGGDLVNERELPSDVRMSNGLINHQPTLPPKAENDGPHPVPHEPLLNQGNLVDFVPTSNSSSVGAAAVSNSDLLIDIFGAAPAVNSDYVENFTFKGPISPLNPFIVDLVDSDSADLCQNATKNDSSVVHGMDWESKNSAATTESAIIDEREVPDFPRNDMAIQRPVVDDHGTAVTDAIDSSQGATCKEITSGFELDSITYEDSELSNNGRNTLNIDMASSEKSRKGILKSPLAVNPSEMKNKAFQPNISNNLAVSEEDFNKFWNDFEDKGTALQEVLPVANAGYERTGAIPKRPKVKSSNFSAVNIRNGVMQEQIVSIAEEKQYSDSKQEKTNSLKPVMKSSYAEGVSGNTETVEKSSTEEVEACEQDEDILSEVPDDLRISDAEFQRFLSQTKEDVSETVVSANASDVAERDSSAGSSSEPGDVQLGTESASVQTPENASNSTHESIVSGGGSSVPSSPVNELENVQEASGNPTLTLQMVEQENTDQNSQFSYPATPPPPYTDEMQNNYEKHLTHERRSIADGQASEVTPAPMDVPPGTSPEDDGFSFLPTSVLQSITRPGETKPEWVPDSDAPQCSNCANKFTFTRRRHHCRACGRVFCATCCSSKSPLRYLDFKEARVCSMCSLAIMQADALTEMSQRSASTKARPQAQVPQEETPVEAATPTVADTTEQQPPDSILQVTQEENPTPEIEHSEPIPVPLPQREGPEGAAATTRTPSTKSVRFSDGTRPHPPDEMPSTPPPPSRMKRVRRKHGYYSKDPNSPDASDLPPIIIAHGEDGLYAVEESPDMNVVIGLLESGGPGPQSFVLNPNLIVHVRFITYAKRQFWCFWSEGLDGVGQRDVVLLLEREGPDDRKLPTETFMFFASIFDRARKGKIFNNTDFMQMSILGAEENEGLFGSEDNAGFLFVQLTSQVLDGLTLIRRKDDLKDDQPSRASSLPISSLLFAILVQKTEAPWATLFPMRLLLRLGMETKQYPCPLFSLRKRQPVFYQLGHTILAILCDFRNFKYRVVSVPGLRVVVSCSGSVSIQIPCNRFTDTIKIMNSSNESVLAMGTGTFGPKFQSRDDANLPMDSPCDSHLVCMQDNNSSNYHTEIMSMRNTDPSYTGAAFVIFNGSLKSDGSHLARCAIVEDGIMVQLLPEKMGELRASLRSMDDFKLSMGPVASSTPQPETATQLVQLDEPQPPSPIVEVRWVDDDTAFNIGMFSPIDGAGFEGVVGFNVQGRSEQKGKRHTLRWNQVFFLTSTSDPIDMSRLAEQVANGCFLALTPVLHELAKHRQHKVAVRVTIHPENVGYVAGSNCQPLPLVCMNALDENLIPTIHNAASNVPVEQEAVVIELLFSILLLRPGYRTV